jgi:hypothetical protein
MAVSLLSVQPSDRLSDLLSIEFPPSLPSAQPLQTHVTVSRAYRVDIAIITHVTWSGPVKGGQARTGIGTHTQAVGTHIFLDLKYVYFDKLDQNLLHSTIPNAKSFASRRSRSKSLGSHWFPCGRVMQDPAVSLYSSRDVIRRRLRVDARTMESQTHTRSKTFGCMSHKCKISWISTALDQNLLHSTS